MSKMTRAELKETFVSAIESQKLRSGTDLDPIGEEGQNFSVLLSPSDHSSAFYIQISANPAAKPLEMLQSKECSQSVALKQPPEYRISVACLREGHSIATHSILNYITSQSTYVPALESQYVFAESENELTLGFLKLDLCHDYEGLKMDIRETSDSVFQTALEAFKIQAKPLKYERSISAIVKKNDGILSPRYAIFEDEEIAFGPYCSSLELEKRPFLVNGAGTSQEQLHIHQFSRLVDQNPGVEKKHVAPQFEVFLSVFDSTQGRISWLVHTTSGGEIAQGKAEIPDIAWAVHPNLPILVWHVPGHHLRISNLELKESPISIAGMDHFSKKLF